MYIEAYDNKNNFDEITCAPNLINNIIMQAIAIILLLYCILYCVLRLLLS